MVDKLQSGGVQVNQIADALGGHVRIEQSGGHHTGVAVAQGAAGVEGMAQTCKSSRKSTLGGLVISIGVPGLHPDTSRRQSCAKFQRTGKLRGKGHLPDDGFIPLYQRLVRGEGWRQQRGGWHGTGTFGDSKRALPDEHPKYARRAVCLRPAAAWRFVPPPAPGAWWAAAPPQG